MSTIKIMSFNMKRNYKTGGEKCFYKRKEGIRQIIQQYNPDVIGTQELTNETLNILGNLLSDYVCIGDGREGKEKGEYTAILYRKDKFALKEEHTFWLSPTPERQSRAWLAMFPRICTTCVLTLKEDQKQSLRVYNTHLDHISYWARVKGLGVITKLLREANKENVLPAILMGDFNAIPTSRTIRKWQKEKQREGIVLKSAFHEIEDLSTARSYHGFKGKIKGMPIDYIYATEDVAIKEVHLCRDQIDGIFPSDHYPLLATIQLEE